MKAGYAYHYYKKNQVKVIAQRKVILKNEVERVLLLSY
jgi:hypothetical protein